MEARNAYALCLKYKVVRKGLRVWEFASLRVGEGRDLPLKFEEFELIEKFEKPIDLAAEPLHAPAPVQHKIK